MFKYKFLGKEFNFNSPNTADSIKLVSNLLNLPIKTVCQVHDDNILVVKNLDQNTSEICADAIITDIPNVAIAIKTADCIPLLIYGVNKLGIEAIAAIHMGRKSALLELASKVIKKLKTEFELNPSDLKCFIGPHIKQANHFSFQDEWRLFPKKFIKKMPIGIHTINNSQLLQNYLDKNNLKIGEFHTWQTAQINLTDFVVDQIIKTGLTREQIEVSDIDTYIHVKYNSYRRDYPNTKSNFSYIYLC